MAKSRYVQDSFWTDPYIEKLTPDEKLVFLHLLTNPQCNVAGVYELRAKRLAYETGYDIEVVETILKRFQKENKIIKHNDWIILVNHLKHQHLGSKTAEGINRIIETTPQEVKTLFSKEVFSTEDSESYEVYVLKQIPHIYPIQGVSKLPYSEVKLSIVKLSNKKYGELNNVSLSEEEYGKLINTLGESKTLDLIRELDLYLASTGKRYKSHYATILAWDRRKKDKVNSNSKKLYVG